MHLRREDVAQAEGDDLHARPSVEGLGCNLVYYFGQPVAILGKLRMIFIYRKVLRREKLRCKAKAGGRFARGEDYFLYFKNGAGLEHVLGRVCIHSEDLVVGEIVSIWNRREVDDS